MQDIILRFSALSGCLKYQWDIRGRGKCKQQKIGGMLRHEDNISQKTKSNMPQHETLMSRHAQKASKLPESIML